MTLNEVMHELELLGNERMKKRYIGSGAREPLFGVTTGAMKPLFKKIKINQPLAEELYATGNYDAMYFAGMIADPKSMTEADFDRWMEGAYFPMLSDFVVAVTMAESDCGQSAARRWIESGRELHASAGWACYEWMLGWRPDGYFDTEVIRSLLKKAVEEFDSQPERVKYSIGGFIEAVGISYLPLHEEALAAATEDGKFEAALKHILKAKESGKIGFKRKAVRC